MMRNAVTILLIVLAGSLSAQHLTRKQKFLRDGGRFALVGEVSKALLIYDSGINEYPEEPLFLVLKAEALTRSDGSKKSAKIYTAASELYRRALQIDSTSYKTYSSRAIFNLNYHHYDDAVNDFTNVLSLTRGDKEEQFRAFGDRANAKLFQNDFEGAIEDYDRALEIQPHNNAIKVSVATVYIHLEQLKKAEALLRGVLKEDPADLNATNNLGALFISAKQYNDAIQIFEKGISQHPNEADLYSNLGLAKVKVGKAAEALQLINKSLELLPDDDYAYKHRGMAHLALGKKDEACRDFFRAQELAIELHDELRQLIKENCKN